MVETALAFLVALAGGFLPVISIEVYLVGATAMLGDAHVAAMALAAGVGQTLGKVPYYYMGRGALNLPWLRRRMERAEGTGRWARRLAAWREKAERRPLWAGWALLVSAFASIPPFMLVCVVAGTLRMNPLGFLGLSLLGRTARFALVGFVPHVATGWFT